MFTYVRKFHLTSILYGTHLHLTFNIIFSLPLKPFDIVKQNIRFIEENCTMCASFKFSFRTFISKQCLHTIKSMLISPIKSIQLKDHRHKHTLNLEFCFAGIFVLFKIYLRRFKSSCCYISFNQHFLDFNSDECGIKWHTERI